MTNDNDRLTRRELVTGALVGAAAMVLPSQATAADAAPLLETPTTEGALLISLVPVNVDYQLTETQVKEAAAQLKDYPGSFAGARKRMLPEDLAPAFAPTSPQPLKRGKK